MQEKRLAKLEARLESKQKVLAWFHKLRQFGGFAEAISHALKTNDRVLLDDMDAVFVHKCVGSLNTDAIGPLFGPNPGIAMTMLYLLRLAHSRGVPVDPFEIDCLRRVVRNYYVNAAAFDEAQSFIREHYLDGIAPLFEDAELLLHQRMNTAQTLRAWFNTLAKEWAPQTLPIQDQELDEAVRLAVPKMVNSYVQSARGQAEHAMGNDLAARETVLDMLRDAGLS